MSLYASYASLKNQLISEIVEVLLGGQMTVEHLQQLEYDHPARQIILMDGEVFVPRTVILPERSGIHLHPCKIIVKEFGYRAFDLSLSKEGNYFIDSVAWHHVKGKKDRHSKRNCLFTFPALHITRSSEVPIHYFGHEHFIDRPSRLGMNDCELAIVYNFGTDLQIKHNYSDIGDVVQKYYRKLFDEVDETIRNKSTQEVVKILQNLPPSHPGRTIGVIDGVIYYPFNFLDIFQLCDYTESHNVEIQIYKGDHSKNFPHTRLDFWDHSLVSPEGKLRYMFRA